MMRPTFGSRRPVAIAAAVTVATLISAPALSQSIDSTEAETERALPPSEEASGLTVRSMERPTTLPPHAMRVDVQPTTAHSLSDTATLSLYLGGGVGLPANFEVGAQVAALDLVPSFDYTSPSVYVMYGRDLTDAISLAPNLNVSIPVHEDDPWIMDLSLGLSVEIAEFMELVFSPAFSIGIHDVNDLSLSVLFQIPIQVTDRFFLMPQTGVGLDRFDNRFLLSRGLGGALDFETVTLPAGLTAGYTVGKDGGPLADIQLQWYWPQLYVPTQSGATRVNSDDWSLMLATSIYFNL